jgi:hypothetical protein
VRQLGRFIRQLRPIATLAKRVAVVNDVAADFVVL